MKADAEGGRQAGSLPYCGLPARSLLALLISGNARALARIERAARTICDPAVI